MKKELDFEKKLLIVSLIISASIISVGIVTKNSGVIGNGIIFSAFIIFVPLVLFRYERFRTLKEYEEKFPAFLRDIVESLHSGMPLHQAIVVCSRVDYGRLSKEVKKMSNQISWGIPVDKVIDQFTERVKKSKRLYMALKVLRESYLTGGDIESTLESVAENLSILDDAQKERSSLLNQYVVLMYAITFIFLGILVSINKLMIPMGTESLGFSNPCASTQNFICSIYEFPSVYIFTFKDPASVGAYYASIFFYMSIIVAVACGLVAGQISENSLTAGIKHSVVMSFSVVGIMLVLKAAGILGI
ncbi:MAG: type II secretion system F family protein [Candidatus Aenigmatarchaeota archaeon]